MDEVDIDNVEDLNELEARLYAQVHHEATNEQNIQLKNGVGQVSIPNGRDFEKTSNTNRFLSGRYWASERNSPNQWQQKPVEQPPQRFIRNPFKAPNKFENHHRSTKQFEKSKYADECAKQVQDLNKKTHAEKTLSTTSPNDDVPSSSSSSSSLHIGNNNSKTAKSNTIAKGKLPAEKSNLKPNPIAKWMQRWKNRNNKSNTNSKNSKNSPINVKQGLFARQQEKLQKMKRIEERKQKSRKARNVSVRHTANMKSTEIIDLDSNNESDASDVIMIPTALPTIFTIDDSPDEYSKDEEHIINYDENAVDLVDMRMASTEASFIKPQKTCSHHASAVADGSGKCLENSSRCTSPCSLQSSDDFIGQKDRSRLLAGARGIADEDLSLISDSMLEAPGNSKQIDEYSLGSKNNSPESSVKRVNRENVENNDAAKSASKTTNSQERSRDYRVDHDQYRALDVYESESDITDGVYSKGAKKPTVIRKIDTSSDEAEDIGSCVPKTKRLRKRRASSCNKESDANNEHITSSSDNKEDDTNEDDDNKLLRTPIPFIAKGVAVERYNSRKRKITSTSPTVAHKRRNSANIRSASDHMSDTEFIETLNNLAQGQDSESEIPPLEESEESEIENVPTARDIAEKTLAKQSALEKAKKSSTDDIAIPNDILSELSGVFETIDQFDRNDGPLDGDAGDTIHISDSSDSEREKYFVYKSVPNEEAQIIEYCPNVSKAQNFPAKAHAADGSPIYNVIYIRGPRTPGGVGWNEEMRKFYNDSWNGEHFTVSNVLQKLNPNKKLWKICMEDRFNMKRFKTRCKNCDGFGHTTAVCKRPRRPMVCYVCGDVGHHKPNCPKTICLRCGNKTQVFTRTCNACLYQNRLTCPLCKMRGHSLEYCPDKWRRYHSTTEGNIQPISSINYNPRKSCCICGGLGHIADNCRSSGISSDYPILCSSIKSHQKSYSDVVIKSPYNGIALNLMYKPYQQYEFDLVDHTSCDKYYGRFLKAVGMDFLLNQKHNGNRTEMADTTAEKAQRLTTNYEANPYSKVGTAIRNSTELLEKTPNQVQEITESSKTDQQNSEHHPELENVSDNDDQCVSCTVNDDELETKLQLNTINNVSNAMKSCHNTFKPPQKVASTTSKSQTESALLLDSDSNYSFSEHFDEAASAENETASQELPSWAKAKRCKMDILPDFIPLIETTERQYEEDYDYENTVSGISKNFIGALSDDDEMGENRNMLSPLSDLPCDAKIYLTQFHSKYLLSPAGNAFLRKSTKKHKLRARLDFASVGHVLVIFGFPTDQNNFQRELLMKYRQLEDERNQSQLNVPKRTYALIRFLRDNIAQLMKNLGNVNHLFKRMQYLERQQTKSSDKLAEKLRKSLNMILIGQAGLQGGNIHLDNLLMSLKKLINEVRDNIAPPQLRSEIIDHFKVIFSGYRHENYQKLVETYTKLMPKNRMLQLNIDPVLLGGKVLDTTFNQEQKQRLDQIRAPIMEIAADTKKEAAKEILPSLANRKNAKLLKQNQNSNTAILSTTKIRTATVRDDKISSTSNIKTKSTFNDTPASFQTDKTAAGSSTLVKTKDSSESCATVSTTIKEVPDKWKNAYDSLFTQMKSENTNSNKNKIQDSNQASPFWSRESLRYLDNCVRLAAARPHILEQLKLIQNKSQNGQLSYNDYLAVLRLHSALNKNENSS